MKRRIPAALLDLKKRFEHWRATRIGNPRIPEDLLTGAAQLSLKYGITIVSRQLGINHAVLKVYIQKIQGSSSKQPEATSLVSQNQDLSELRKRFVELNPVLHQEPYTSSHVAQVYCELEGLKIFLKSPEASDWRHLFAGFFEATRNLPRAG